MSTSYYYPEMGQAKPENTEGEISLAFGGRHYFIKTPLELSGRGIKHLETLDETNCTNPAKYGWNRYKVTTLAMSKIEKLYNFSMELLLD